MLIPSPSAVFLRILGVALLEHWTKFFELSTCKSSVHALRMVFANGFNEITHSTNKCKIIFERKSVCHGFVAAGVFKRFGFEASRGWRLSFLLMLKGEVPDVFRGFRWVFLNFAMRNRLPRMHQNEIHHFCNPSSVPTWRFAWDWFLAYVFTGSPPFVSRPNSHSSVSWMRQVSQEGQEELLEAPMTPSTIALQGFWRFGCHGLLPKMEKKQCFNWGCPSNLGVPSCSSLTDLNHIPVFFSWSLISTHHPITTNIVPTYQHSSRFGLIVSSLRLKEHEHNDTVYIVVWEWVELSYVDVFSSRGFQTFG